MFVSEFLKISINGKTSKGSQRFRCARCTRTFTDTFDTLYYRRQVTPGQAELILQAHAEGSSLRDITRLGHRAYGTVVSVVRAESQKAEIVHTEEIKDVKCQEISGDEMWSFVKKAHRLRRGFLGVKPEQAAEAL